MIISPWKTLRKFARKKRDQRERVKSNGRMISWRESGRSGRSRIDPSSVPISGLRLKPLIRPWRISRKISEAEAMEIVSLAPDQPSQTHLAKFVRGEEDPSKYYKGQGGVPIRSLNDLKVLKDATRRGNWPMTRIYSGTDRAS